MITIVGGEMLCALGTGAARIKALKDGTPGVGGMSVKMGAEAAAYPYFFLDGTPRDSGPAAIAVYLDRIISSLLNKLDMEASDLAQAGIFLGSSAIDFFLARPIEQAARNIADNRPKPERVGCASYVGRLRKRFGFQGPALTFNTACTSSANAMLEAAAMLAGRIIDHALVLGLEISSPTTREGFAVMQLLSPEAVRPFARNRDGMVLGESVSAVLLSRKDVMASNWRYLGGKSCCETYSVTGPDPSGKGIGRVISAALEEAGILPGQITAVKAHGTGGELMDLAEIRGMELAFNDLPPYFSLKPYIGHTLGGCGLAELLLVMECVEAGFVPATLNCATPDPEFSQGPIRETQALSSGCFMLNYFGFGGNNTSFIIEKAG